MQQLCGIFRYKLEHTVYTYQQHCSSEGMIAALALSSALAEDLQVSTNSHLNSKLGKRKNASFYGNVTCTTAYVQHSSELLQHFYRQDLEGRLVRCCSCIEFVTCVYASDAFASLVRLTATSTLYRLTCLLQRSRPSRSLVQQRSRHAKQI